MNWILENLNIVVILAGVVAYWLNNLRQAKEEGKQLEEEVPVDFEEIFGRDAQQSVPPPPPLPHTVVLPPPPPLPRSVTMNLQSELDAELERQRNLEERVRTMRKSREGRTGGAAATERSVRKKAAKEEVASIRSRLRDREEVRRSIVLREVLGKPVGMG